jgi:hypothetical protein
MRVQNCKCYESITTQLLDDDIIPPRDSDAAYWRERLSVEIELSRVLNRVSFMVGMFIGGGLVVVGFLLVG